MIFVVNRLAGSVYSSKPSLCCVGVVVGHLELQCSQVTGQQNEEMHHALTLLLIIQRGYSSFNHNDCWDVAALISTGTG